MRRDDELEEGVYSPGMTGALAGVSGYSIGQWARYGLIRPSVYRGRPAHLYSYRDVAEAIVIHWMTSQGITYRDIRDALDDVAAEHPRWPLLTAPLGVGRLSVDDRALLVKEEDRGVYLETSRRRKREHQIIIKPVLLERARDMLAHGGWLAAERGLKRIEVLPLKLGGVPTIVGRRWTVDQVARLAWDEPGRALLEEAYAMPAAEIDEAVSWMDGAHELAQ